MWLFSCHVILLAWYLLIYNGNLTLLFFQAYVRHPELASARANRDYAYQQVKNAIDKISGVAQASGQSDAHPYEGAGELASALDELMVSIYNIKYIAFIQL